MSEGKENHGAFEHHLEQGMAMDTFYNYMYYLSFNSRVVYGQGQIWDVFTLL